MNDIAEWKSMFDEINKVDFRPYSNIEFYAQQIANISGSEDFASCEEIAKKLSEY